MLLLLLLGMPVHVLHARLLHPLHVWQWWYGRAGYGVVRCWRRGGAALLRWRRSRCARGALRTEALRVASCRHAGHGLLLPLSLLVLCLLLLSHLLGLMLCLLLLSMSLLGPPSLQHHLCLLQELRLLLLVEGHLLGHLGLLLELT